MTKQKIELRENAYAYRFDRYRLTVDNLEQTIGFFLERNPLFLEENIHFSIDYAHGYYDDIEIEAHINAWRLETDDEYQKRLDKEEEKRKRDAENARKSRADAKAKRDAKDLVEYERLRKKFEKSQK